MTKAKSLIPTFLGALGGAYLLLFPALGLVIAVGTLAAVLLGLLWTVYRRFNRSPRFWGAVLELWILFLPLATALAVLLLLWLTIEVEPGSLVRLPGWSAHQMADLVKYVAGIVTGLAAALVSDEPEENVFWPAFHFRRLAAKAVTASAREDPLRFYAAHMPATLNNEAKGWGFRARRVRAGLIAEDQGAA